MWTEEFDKIVLINLSERVDRFDNAVKELAKHNISFSYCAAIKHEVGAYGLYLTLKKVLERAEAEDCKNILVFEDDVQFEHENFNDFMNTAIQELKYLDWDLFYLGGNVFKSLTRVPKCNYILRTDGTCSTHAVCYSKQGWKLMLEEMRRIEKAGVDNPEPIDMILVRAVQSRGKSFIANPLLCTQRPGWSDVEKRETDYKNLIQERYEQRLKELK